VSLIYSLIDTVVAFLLQHILGYRKAVITANLKNSLKFNQKNELQRVININYRYMARLFREIVVTPSRKLLQHKLELEPCPALDEWLKEGKSILIAMGHVGNWEWSGAYMGIAYPDQVCPLYKKIKSRYVNALMLKRRSLHVNHLIEIGQMGELLRLIRRKAVMVLLIADQNPGSDQGLIWAKFFGRDTAFVNGPESLALRYQLPVVYLNIHTTAEKKYHLDCRPLFDGKEKVNPGEITQRFADLLEANIRSNNLEWLWSHRRWKRKKVVS
jgi:KDO2-lipid IV(A) lauroyltransferase